MEVAVWDTYVDREDNQKMHFDILVPKGIYKEEQILEFGRHYLNTKKFKTAELTIRECQFCHMEEASKKVVEMIKLNGYAIIELENCI